MSNQAFEVQRNQSAFWFACVDIAVLDDERLTPIEKIVFCLLCRYTTWQKRECFPSVKIISQKAKCSEYSVQKALKKLVELGLIERKERFINGRQTTSLYTIIGFEAPCYKGDKDCGEGSICLTPPPSTLTDGGQRDVPQNENQINDIITLTREAELPKSSEPEKTNSHGNAVESQEKTISDKPKTEKNVIKAENSNSDELFAPESAPNIMHPTARYLLQRTGRSFLAWEEILALRELSASQMPSRVQKEIDTACERFKRQGKPLSSLRFEYIASALRNQPTRGNKAKFQSTLPRRERRLSSIKYRAQNSISIHAPAKGATSSR